MDRVGRMWCEGKKERKKKRKREKERKNGVEVPWRWKLSDKKVNPNWVSGYYRWLLSTKLTKLTLHVHYHHILPFISTYWGNQYKLLCYPTERDREREREKRKKEMSVLGEYFEFWEPDWVNNKLYMVESTYFLIIKEGKIKEPRMGEWGRLREKERERR